MVLAELGEGHQQSIGQLCVALLQGFDRAPVLYTVISYLQPGQRGYMSLGWERRSCLVE
jgi:hypothetical protein